MDRDQAWALVGIWAVAVGGGLYYRWREQKLAEAAAGGLVAAGGDPGSLQGVPYGPGYRQLYETQPSYADLYLQGCCGTCGDCGAVGCGSRA